jgi:Protein of unknown function (DUF1573)
MLNTTMTITADHARAGALRLDTKAALLWLALGILGLSHGLAQTSPPPTEASSTNSGGPKLRFASLDYDFGEVTAGFIVRHEYAFTNAGTEDLEITNVQPQCGCTTTGNWTRNTKPGESGTIPIQLNSVSFDGPISKHITVVSNDKSNSPVVLTLHGKVWKPVLVIPEIATFGLQPDAPFGSASVRITNRFDQPLILSAPAGSNNLFVALLQTNIPGKEYLVTISNTTVLRPRAQAQGQIELKTTWTNLPLITIPVTATMGPSVIVSPNRIGLDKLPLPTNYTARFVILNNTTNHLVVSDPKISDDQLTVEIQETQPGKYFTGSVKFPAGFAFHPGKPVQLTFKTSDPDVPLIKMPVIPIIRLPSPVVPRLPPRTNSSAIPPPPGPK